MLCELQRARMKKKKKGRRRRGVSVDGKYTVTHTHTRRVVACAIVRSRDVLMMMGGRVLV